MTDRVHALDGVRNFRDFGGYGSTHGGELKRGLLFRSGHYAEASDGDIARLGQLNIAFQVDLRRPDERERLPGKWSAPNTITHDGGREMQSPHHRFLQQVEASPEVAEGWMVEYYALAPFRPHHVDLYRNWFSELAGTQDAGLVNCAAGKDRTGIICALTHHVLGVSWDDTMADYELTNTAAKVDERLPEATAYFNDMLGKSYAPDVYRPFIGVRGHYLDTAFEHIRKTHGTVDDYLAAVLGVDEAMRTRLVDRLVG